MKKLLIILAIVSFSCSANPSNADTKLETADGLVFNVARTRVFPGEPVEVTCNGRLEFAGREIDQNDEGIFTVRAPIKSSDYDVVCTLAKNQQRSQIEVISPNIGDVSAIVKNTSDQIEIYSAKQFDLVVYSTSPSSATSVEFSMWLTSDVTDLQAPIITRAILSGDGRSSLYLDFGNRLLIRKMNKNVSSWDLFHELICGDPYQAGLVASKYDDIAVIGEDIVQIQGEKREQTSGSRCQSVAFNSQIGYSRFYGTYVAPLIGAGAAYAFSEGSPNDMLATKDGTLFLFGSQRHHAACLNGCSDYLNKANWTYPDIPIDEDFIRVSGTTSKNVWAVGNLGAVIHFDGIKWSAVNTGTDENLHALWVDNDETSYVGGEKGTFLRCKTSTLSCKSVF